MSLRIRLNLLITLLFISLFACTSYYIIANARKSVQHEIYSSVQLALQLIQFSVTSASLDGGEQRQMRIMDRLSELDEIRHLHIEIRNPTDAVIPVDTFDDALSATAPTWFIKLVEPPPTEIRRWLHNPIIPPTGIVVRADPSDEIDETWLEVRGILVFLLIFILLCNIMIFLTIGRYLSPIEHILKALSGIEKGNYQLALPHFRLPELDRISERFNTMARVLQKSRAENQTLTQRSMQIQEDERRHLAQELHDELGQTVTAIKAVAAAISSTNDRSSEQIDMSVNTILEYSDHIYRVAKNMMHRLRPSVLDEFGLVKALQNMLDDWNSRQDNIFCRFDFSEIPQNLSESLKISIYRIVQESLTNAAKHSAASQMMVKLALSGAGANRKIQLCIEDNGMGLDKNNIVYGFGLLGMKERVEMNQGQFELISSRGNGLKINIVLPVKQENVDE